MSGTSPKLILASASPRRLDLLGQIGILVDAVKPADINEDPIGGEIPREHALRLAREKAGASFKASRSTIRPCFCSVISTGQLNVSP